jgi:trk system potassium uptake protein TrkH
LKQLSLDRNTFKILLSSYIIIALLGAIILNSRWANISQISFIDAFFTSTSAINMTGLIVKNTAANFILAGQIIILILIQIIDLGYMSIWLFIYILIRKNLD